jgi:Intracellular proteinase inhibitor
MKYALLILAAMAPTVAMAQTVDHPRKLTSTAAATAFSVQPPDEGSPFFSVREAALSYASQQATNPSQDQVAIYPKVKNSPGSAAAMFNHFFTDMFASVKLGTLHQTPSTQTLTITPQDFSLQDRRDLDTVYSVRNNTSKMVKLAFPTTQRIEITTTDSSGTVIDKWSDDRAFEPQDGLVVINPKERIEYRETVPTREMKPAQPYAIQSSVVGYPDYTVEKTVTPRP